MIRPLPILLLLSAAAFLPAGQASGQAGADLLTGTAASPQHCLHFTNFCDTITLEKTGTLASGGWDNRCGGDWFTASIIGNTNSPAELATRPVDDGLPAPYTTQFSFKAGKLFDLDATLGSGTNPFRTDEPYSITDGACTTKDVDRSKPRLMSGIEAALVGKPKGQPAEYCLHFTNFCDTVQLQTFEKFATGAWDWLCQQDWISSPIMGFDKAGKELGTRPILNRLDFGPYSVHFSFKPGSLFDLSGTAGVGQGVFAIRTNQPFTITTGSCRSADVDTSKPGLMSR